MKTIYSSEVKLGFVFMAISNQVSASSDQTDVVVLDNLNGCHL